MTVERREEVRVVRDNIVDDTVVSATGEPVYERREAVVHDTTAERRIFLARLASLIWLLTGILVALIAFRVGLRLLDANGTSDFASFVYGITNPFVAPFFGLTNTPAAAAGVLEIPSLIAMAVYVFVAWVVVQLLRILFAPARRPDTVRRVKTYRRE
jgi:uncharacterized protein YggT (Ycf19 family)